MNNNTKLLIMFILIIIIFYFYSINNQNIQTANNIVSDTIVKDTVIEKQPVIIQKQVKRETMKNLDTLKIPFETELIKGNIMSIGGSFYSIIIKNHKAYTDTVLEILSNDNAIALKIESQQKLYDFSNVNFSVIYEGQLNPLLKDKDSIVLEGIIDSMRIKRIYIFNKDSYFIEHKVYANQNIEKIVFLIESGLNITELNEKDDLQYFAIDAYSNKELIRNKIKAVKDTLTIGGRFDWFGLQSKYFFIGFLGKGIEFTAFALEDKRIGAYFVMNEQQTRIYAGPIDYNILKSFNNGMDKLVNFGWAWISPISRMIMMIFSGIYRVIPNYGFVTIIFAFLFILLFSPLTFKSYTSMQKMQLLQPQLKELKKRYEKDPQKLNQETMKLYKKHGANPFTGCLPLFIQMPVFFALYSVLRSSIDLRGAPFILWISDLSMKDPYFVLPILMGITMFVSQKFSATDQSQKMLVYTMPVIMTIFFINFPSGVVLYWFTYNLFSIVQQYIIRRKLAKEKEVANEQIN